MDFRVVPLSEIPETVVALLWAAGRSEASAGWYRTLAATTLAPDETALAALAEDFSEPRAAIVLVRKRDGALRGLSAPYTTWFGPAARDPGAAEFLGHGLKQHVRGVLRLDALDSGEPHTAAFIAGLEGAGLITERHRHFRNWHETITDFAAYWGARESRLKETVRRKRKRLERDGRLTFSCLRRPEEISAGVAVYEALYAASWKPPEPYPDFIARLAHTLAGEGTFRLGLAYIDGKPAAAQIWLIRDKRATIFKLAHAPAFDAHSPGTILTHWLLSELHAQDAFTELDLGRGDDSYKRLWLGEGRYRIGLTACNPANFAGLYHIVRDIWPTRAARILRRSGKGSRA